METSARPVALITGIAEGLGANIAGTFASAGYDIAGVSRTEGASALIGDLVDQAGGAYRHLCCDISDPVQVQDSLLPLAERITVVVHNAHVLVIKPFGETTLDEFENVWRTTCFGALVAARCAVPAMVKKGGGTLIFTGATASVRAGAKFSAFASAKFALRGLAQSMAREFGPKGVHVAHVILDGLIEEPQTERRFGTAHSVRMRPEEIARAYLELTRQHPSAWTHELDLRPSSEQF